MLESFFLYRESKNNSVGMYLFSIVVLVVKFFVVYIWFVGIVIFKSMICVR